MHVNSVSGIFEMLYVKALKALLVEDLVNESGSLGSLTSCSDGFGWIAAHWIAHLVD